MFRPNFAARSRRLPISLVCAGVVGLALGLGGAGCASRQTRAEIPSGAQVVAEGSNRISYTAPRDGMLWVFNQANGNMEYAARVARGDALVVDPDADKITLNGRVVNDKPLTTVDQKRIFFEPDATTATERRVERVYEERTYEPRR